MSGPRSRIPVALSTSSMYPLRLDATFAIAQDLGYDGIEVMVTHRAETQQASMINEAVQRFGLPVMAIHAPTLLLTQQVWGTADEKLWKSAQLAAEVGASAVVAHPRSGGRALTRCASRSWSMRSRRRPASCSPWRTCTLACPGREAKMYLPHWNPVAYGYKHVTWDFARGHGRGRLLRGGEGSGLSPAPRSPDRRLVQRLQGRPPRAGARRAAGGRIDGADRSAGLRRLRVRRCGRGGSVHSQRQAGGERERMLADSLRFARYHLGQED